MIYSVIGIEGESIKRLTDQSKHFTPHIWDTFYVLCNLRFYQIICRHRRPCKLHMERPLNGLNSKPSGNLYVTHTAPPAQTGKYLT